MQHIACLEGFYFFNFAAIAPFLATDQIQLISTGFAGGPMKDMESH